VQKLQLKQCVVLNMSDEEIANKIDEHFTECIKPPWIDRSYMMKKIKCFMVMFLMILFGTEKLLAIPLEGPVKLAFFRSYYGLDDKESYIFLNAEELKQLNEILGKLKEPENDLNNKVLPFLGTSFAVIEYCVYNNVKGEFKIASLGINKYSFNPLGYSGDKTTLEQFKALVIKLIERKSSIYKKKGLENE